MKTFDDCNWAVCSDIDMPVPGGHEKKRSVLAWFPCPMLAEDYIEHSIAKTEIDRFYVIHRKDMKTEERSDDYDRTVRKLQARGQL